MTAAQPKIELRKISYNSRLSEETSAYSAQVWVDGEHIVDVLNRGHGGCDETNPPPKKNRTPEDWKAFHQKLEALETTIKTTFPSREADLGDGRKFMIEPSLEGVCGELLTDWLIAKDVKRDLAKKVMFTKPTGGLYSVKIPKPTPAGFSLDRLIDAVKKKEGIEKTLNEMTTEEAVAIYKKQAA